MQHFSFLVIIEGTIVSVTCSFASGRCQLTAEAQVYEMLVIYQWHAYKMLPNISGSTITEDTLISLW